MTDWKDNQFLKKSVKVFDKSKLKFYLCQRITNHTKKLIRETDSDIRSVVNHPGETDEKVIQKKMLKYLTNQK